MNKRTWPIVMAWAGLLGSAVLAADSPPVQPNAPANLEGPAAPPAPLIEPAEPLEPAQPLPLPPKAPPVGVPASRSATNRPVSVLPRPVRAEDIEPPAPAPIRPERASAAQGPGGIDKATDNAGRNAPDRFPPGQQDRSPIVDGVGEGDPASGRPTAAASREQLPLGRASDRPGRSKPEGMAGLSGSWLWQTAGALALVIALIFALRGLLRRMAGQSGGGQSPSLVEVLARCPVGPKMQVLFLKIQHRILVTAQSPAGLQTLMCLEDPHDIAQLLAAIDASRPNSLTRSFRQMLGRLDRGYQQLEDEPADAGSSVEPILDRAREQVAGLLGRLRRMNRDS